MSSTKGNLGSANLYIQDTTQYIQGSILDKATQNILALAAVRILNTKVYVMADKKGYYKLVIPDSILNKKVTIQFEFVGYNSYTVKARLRKLPKTINVELSEKIVPIIKAY